MATTYGSSSETIAAVQTIVNTGDTQVNQNTEYVTMTPTEDTEYGGGVLEQPNNTDYGKPYVSTNSPSGGGRVYPGYQRPLVPRVGRVLNNF